jgi:protein gp37
VWLGVSCEDQRRADERIPLLLQTPAAVRFISAEPLLGPVDLTEILPHPKLKETHPYDPHVRLNAFTGLFSGMDEYVFGRVGLDWVIAGGESGPGSRQCDIGWIRGLVEQCEAAGVACFVKQQGTNPIEEWVANGGCGYGRTIDLKSAKGGDPAEWPADLRVREFPR